MKKFLSFCAFTLLVFSSLGVSAQDTKGDDLFPWPWGTECPFPWQEISGSYQVQSKDRGIYSWHFLSFEVNDSKREDLKFLKITQYDHRGIIQAEGRGYSKKDQRVVRGVLTPVDGSSDYAVIVRSYVKDTKKLCRGDNLVTAATFCPLRGRKCLEDSNYVLEKIKSL